MSVYKCIQEVHFLSHIHTLCPKLLLCGEGPQRLALVLSHDCRSLLELFRLTEEGDLQGTGGAEQSLESSAARRRLAGLV